MVSPDGDVQVEDYSGSDEDIAAVRYARSRTDVPAGLVGRLLYRFEEDIPGDDLVIYRRTAVLVCEEEWVERMPGQTAAVYMSTITTAAVAQPAAHLSGGKTTPDRDERILSISFRQDSSRLKVPWRDTVVQLSEDPYVDWPVEGPRTTLFCCNFLNRRGGGPMDHHHWWLRQSGLDADDTRVKTHRVGLQMLDMAGTYDYLEVANVASLELVMRQVQLVEYDLAYGYSSDSAENVTAVARRHRDLADHGPVFDGLSAEEGTVMCCPALLEHVHGKVSKGQVELKQLRKAREESELLKKSTGPGGGRGKKK